jgi:cytochrome c-type biogenesis protein CcmF
MVRWLWLGALMIGLGALLTVADRRYRTQVKRRDAPVVGVAGVAP